MPPMPPLQAALLDLDGTLIDTSPDFVVALNQVLDELGLRRIDRGFVERTVGKGSEHLIRSMLAEVGAEAGRFDAAWPLYQRHYLAVNGQHARVYPGVLEGLQQFQSRGLKLACVTNKPQAFADPLLAAKGLKSFFSHVFGGEAFERRKPDPLPLLKACEALGCAPAQTLMIGDSANDAVAARAAGCPVVLVTYGYNHGEPVTGVDADAFVARLDALRW